MWIRKILVFEFSRILDYLSFRFSDYSSNHRIFQVIFDKLPTLRVDTLYQPADRYFSFAVNMGPTVRCSHLVHVSSYLKRTLFMVYYRSALVVSAFRYTRSCRSCSWCSRDCGTGFARTRLVKATTRFPKMFVVWIHSFLFILTGFDTILTFFGHSIF